MSVSTSGLDPKLPPLIILSEINLNNNCLWGLLFFQKLFGDDFLICVGWCQVQHCQVIFHMTVNICWAFIIILGTLCARNPTACRQRCRWLLQLPSVMPGGLSGAPAAINWRPPLWDKYLQFISCQLIPLQKSWDDARTYCVCTESADLVDIQSAAEDGFLQVLTGGTAAIWIGRK